MSKSNIIDVWQVGQLQELVKGLDPKQTVVVQAVDGVNVYNCFLKAGVSGSLFVLNVSHPEMLLSQKQLVPLETVMKGLKPVRWILEKVVKTDSLSSKVDYLLPTTKDIIKDSLTRLLLPAKLSAKDNEYIDNMILSVDTFEQTWDSFMHYITKVHCTVGYDQVTHVV